MFVRHAVTLWALTVHYLMGDSKGQKPEMDRPFLLAPARVR